ncbi:MAG: hypothetical protein VB082_10010 [Christensenella sp.]|nr:hypothetical protein [Christensenella sp.]
MKKKKSKKILAFLLSMTLVLTLMPFQMASAQEVSGEPSQVTQTEPAPVASTEQSAEPFPSASPSATPQPTASFSTKEKETVGSSASASASLPATPAEEEPLSLEVIPLGTETPLDIGSGNLTCNDANTLYRITGSSESNHITVSGGSAQQPVQVDLNGVNINLHKDNDGDSKEASPLTVKSGSYAMIYIGKDNVSAENYLYGGNEHGIGKNWGYAGLCVENGAHVTIAGQGTLTAHGGGVEYGGAGIGGNYDEDMSDLVIDGTMTINATGAYSAPGIGAGRDGTLYNLTIKKGNITAQGGKFAPGIGAGDAVGTGSGGETYGIVISGGTVTAKGGYHAAGIGGSEGGKVENITISSGIITATGGENGAGIGSEGGDCSNIIISGGDITAIGGSQGAGIGSGRDASMSNITISGGVIRATGGKNSAGIGAGDNVNAGNGGDLSGLTISGGNITAQGGENGAGIGGSDDGTVSGLNIVATKALTITATGGNNGAGIGSANHSAGDISIAMNGGSITAKGGENGAGIGGGNGDSGRIYLSGDATINATGGVHGAGIGAGKNSQSGEITIVGNLGRMLIINAKAHTVQGKGRNGAAAIGSGRATGGNISITNAVLSLWADGYAAAVGGGEHNGTATGTVKKISIDNCEIYAYGSDKYGPGIGAGYGGTVDVIEIKNSEYSGGTIGSSSYPNHLSTPNSIQSITIENSNITATASTAPNENWAGIGSGTWGSVDAITIKDSTVNAKGVNGAAGIGTAGWGTSKTIVEYYGGDMGDIIISNSQVTANGANGGAGIGGGFDTSVGDITITNSVVAAVSANTADGGAGIGGGRGECAGKITIKNSEVTATGGKYAAGIGSGGDTSSITTMWNTKVEGIYITDNSKVTANGGEGGAGIGSGMGGRISDSIQITDSEVAATGGYHAAGIGGGANGWGGRGADFDGFYARGKSKITANGGEGGAGIGGGIDGAASRLNFYLTTTPNLDYYVKATGGGGAAGIGSGGVVNTGQEVFTPQGHTADAVTITGGHIVARGGGNADSPGSGAGIGGGARKGVLQNLMISGGYVEAYSGNGDACDIGHGGRGGVDPLISDKDFTIIGGTVIADEWSDETTPQISGGSVSANLKNVKNGSGTRVYRTTLTLAREANALVEKLTTLDNGYGTRDIFSDENKKISLYLPQSEEKAAWADITLTGEKRHYYGTTTTDGNGILKMDGTVSFQNLAEQPVAGNDFVMDLDDSMLAGWKFDFSAALAAHVVETTQSTSPGAQVKLHADAFGNYVVYAQGQQNQDDAVYWSLQGEYHGNITVMQGSISIVENPSKTYDGQVVFDPQVKKNGDGAVTYAYYAGEASQGTLLPGAPKDAGTYTAVATMAKSERYTQAVSDPLTFTIEKCDVTIGLFASGSGTSAKVTASVMGALDTSGSIRFTIKNDETGNEQVETIAITQSGSGYSASVDFERVAAADYTVRAEYIAGDPDNYQCTNSPQTQTYEKNKAFREITVSEIGAKTYGDIPFNLNVTSEDSLSTDAYSYEVVYDEFPNLEDAVAVDGEGRVTVQNAGLAFLKITLTDPTGLYYNDAVAYVRIPVLRAPLHVASYASMGGNRITQMEYGTLDTLSYGLNYTAEDFKNGDTVEDFNNGCGTLSATPLIETLVVSDAPYEIGIAKNGADFVIAGKTYHNVFVSRNYSLILQNGTIAVTPAQLTIRANDVQAKWNTQPEYPYTLDSLVPWDTEESVFSVLPQTTLDTGQTGGKAYGELEPGEYPDAITVTEGTQNINIFGKENYSVTTVSGDLQVGKADAALELTVRSKVYDGNSAEISTTTADGYDGTVQVSYYRVEADAQIASIPALEARPQSMKPVTEPPVGAGVYYAEATVQETGHYTADIDGKYFIIQKASPNPEIPNLPNLEMKDGLTLQDQQLPTGWTWIVPEKTLAVGEIRALAEYTPEDTNNYHSVYRYLNFNVIEKTPDPSDPTDPSQPVAPDNGNNGGSDGGGINGEKSPQTDDYSQTILWLVLLLTAGATIGICFLKERKKSTK